MEKVFKLMNELVVNGIIEKYAIGGAVAAIFYVEPLATFDLDIFVIMKTESLDFLSPVFNWLKNKGYEFMGEHVMVEGMPVQILPAYNELVIEAVENSEKKLIERVPVFVIGAEYLIAIMLQTGRKKDFDRMELFFSEAKFSAEKLEKFLEKHALMDKFSLWQKRWKQNPKSKSKP